MFTREREGRKNHRTSAVPHYLVLLRVPRLLLASSHVPATTQPATKSNTTTNYNTQLFGALVHALWLLGYKTCYLHLPEAVGASMFEHLPRGIRKEGSSLANRAAAAANTSAAAVVAAGRESKGDGEDERAALIDKSASSSSSSSSSASSEDGKFHSHQRFPCMPVLCSSFSSSRRLILFLFLFILFLLLLSLILLLLLLLLLLEYCYF